jgi:hypothetical protein
MCKVTGDREFTNEYHSFALSRALHYTYKRFLSDEKRRFIIIHVTWPFSDDSDSKYTYKNPEKCCTILTGDIE